jgi:hypothetical protein
MTEQIDLGKNWWLVKRWDKGFLIEAYFEQRGHFL